MTLLKTLGRRVRSLITPETSPHRGQILPAKHLRFGGVHFLDDEAFLAAGEADARKLSTWCDLTQENALLDIGCGTGRLPIGILSTIGPLRSYEGVDVSETAIDWCTRHITPHHPTFRFTHIDVRNERYNPQGTAALRLPFPDASFDVIHLYSVFSHMRSTDVRRYMEEFARLLKPSGRVFLTAFVEENVPDEEENPPGYQQQWKGALHCVRFSLPFFRQMLAEAHLSIARHFYGTETDGQSAFFLQKES